MNLHELLLISLILSHVLATVTFSSRLNNNRRVEKYSVVRYPRKNKQEFTRNEKILISTTIYFENFQVNGSIPTHPLCKCVNEKQAVITPLRWSYCHNLNNSFSRYGFNKNIFLMTPATFIHCFVSLFLCILFQVTHPKMWYRHIIITLVLRLSRNTRRCVRTLHIFTLSLSLYPPQPLLLHTC
jgi:hypothetical protein